MSAGIADRTGAVTPGIYLYLHYVTISEKYGYAKGWGYLIYRVYTVNGKTGMG